MPICLRNPAFFFFTLPFFSHKPPIKMPRRAFTAIDFETANANRNSICQVGLVRVMKGQVVDQINVLVRPPHNEYNSFNIGIHGISPAMTANALPFDKVWPALEHYIDGQHVVAHNIGFDKSCLLKTLEHYNILPPSFKAHCTFKLYKAKLSTLCQRYNIELRHHDAHSDALACAQLFMHHLNTTRSYPM
ncbi:MAG TPA: 3'-5' exonuclease [Flavisolibacter sp.]|nr:3'-5' exonuclease [Flavisolibacter sp.]